MLAMCVHPTVLFQKYKLYTPTAKWAIVGSYCASDCVSVRSQL